MAKLVKIEYVLLNFFFHNKGFKSTINPENLRCYAKHNTLILCKVKERMLILSYLTFIASSPFSSSTTSVDFGFMSLPRMAFASMVSIFA